MGMGDRLTRSLFVALAVGLGWGIRGDFGHLLGAMYPGAALGLGFAFVSGERNAFKWAPVLGAIGALGIATGGHMSYGLLHGYAKADTLINYGYGFLTLILQGGAWGCFGSALIGLALEDEPISGLDLAGFAAAVWLAGWIVYTLVVDLAGFHINPDRSDSSIAFTGGVMGAFAWLALNRKGYGLRGAFFGYLGFGLGMALGRFFGNASYLQPLAVNHWNIMEVSCGFIGGLVFTWGMLGKRFPDPPATRSFQWADAFGCLFVMAMIPLLHRVRRMPADEKLPQWSEALAGYGYENAGALSQFVLNALNAVCLLGLVLALVWIWLWAANRQRWIAAPVLGLSLVMLLIQNFNALYWFYPARENFINMHNVFWVMIASMAAYAAWRGGRLQPASEAGGPVPFCWKRWALGGLAVYCLILILSAFVNGEETMQSANMRFPLWSWRDGVPPPR